MRIQKLHQIKLFSLSVAVALTLASCTNDFESVNRNPNLPGDKEKGLDGLASGGLFPGFIQSIIPTGSGGGTGMANNYQVTIDMTGDNWIGYLSPGVYGWDGGSSLPNYYAETSRLNGIFTTMTELSNRFLSIKAATHDVKVEDNNFIYTKRELVDQSTFSIAQIVKIMGYHRATDMFGPIPYSKIKPGDVKVPYDSQEDIYRSFFTELEEAVNTLKTFRDSGGSTLIKDYDPLFAGDVSKWIKLGNSLMLRLAIRVRYADEALAREYASKATANMADLISDKNDVAKLVSGSKFRFYNSLYTLWKTYGEGKMGATIYSYMRGYNDPRLPQYFSRAEAGNANDGYYAVRLGVRTGNYGQYSTPNIPEGAPTYWMKASEVQFLLAEARLFNLISVGTAREYYEKGVKLSFDENEVSLGNYLTTSARPANYEDPLQNANNIAAVSTIDRKWNDSATEEENLERIITQKYIAIFPDGLEAWSEWRRTGYPRIFKEVLNLSNISARDVNSSGTDGGVRRLPFPDSEYRLNGANISAAKALLGGEDNASTAVWWDKKSKN